MHIPHMLLVDSGSKEEAVKFANQWAEINSSHWSDWYEIGGRWEGIFEGEHVVQYSEKPELFETQLKQFIESVEGEKERHLDELDALSIKEIANDSHLSWKAEKVLKLGMNKYFADQQVFDTETYSASLDAFRKRCEENPERQFAVVIDYHF